MHSFKKSLIALAGLLVLFGAIAALTPLASRGQGKQQRGARKFYLTQGQYDGSQALSACAEGYHMASLWEILDPSNLSYDTSLGATIADSGSGPPNGSGWIRTGAIASAGTTAADGTIPAAGSANCQAWTSAGSEAYGTTVLLPIYGDIEADVTIISPWVARTTRCSVLPRVWCVQN